jgi:tetratricopeptide (TPR) repeat protein
MFAEYVGCSILSASILRRPAVFHNDRKTSAGQGTSHLCILAFVLFLYWLSTAALGQESLPAASEREIAAGVAAAPSGISSTEREIVALELAPASRDQLSRAVQQKDFKKAETILVDEVNRDPKSRRSARLLEFAGGIFFLDGDYLNSAIAWEKAQAIAPLEERSRFTLAMAYVRLHRPQWAGRELQKLSAQQPENSLYLYWLSRLDYDAQKYAEAIEKLLKVIKVDPQMTRAYDLLGLCYDYLGRLQDAIANFAQSVQLNRSQAKPSPWPNLDMALCQMELNDLTGAEKNLQEAIAYDPRLAQAKYNLGRVLERQAKYEQAVSALNSAVVLDAAYAEPHYLLGRIYQRLGKPELAKMESERFQQMRTMQAAPTDGSSR